METSETMERLLAAGSARFAEALLEGDEEGAGTWGFAMELAQRTFQQLRDLAQKAEPRPFLRYVLEKARRARAELREIPADEARQMVPILLALWEAARPVIEEQHWWVELPGEAEEWEVWELFFACHLEGDQRWAVDLMRARLDEFLAMCGDDPLVPKARRDFLEGLRRLQEMYADP